jgi:hypothetical protein
VSPGSLVFFLLVVIAGAFFAVNLTLAVLLLNFNGSRSAVRADNDAPAALGAGAEGGDGPAAAKGEEEEDEGFDDDTLDWIGQDHVAIRVGGLAHGGGGSGRRQDVGDIAALARALSAQADAEAAAAVPDAVAARPAWMEAPMPNALRRPHAFAWRRARLVGYRLITARHFEGASFCVIMANTLVMCLTWCAAAAAAGGGGAIAPLTPQMTLSRPLKPSNL